MPVSEADNAQLRKSWDDICFAWKHYGYEAEEALRKMARKKLLRKS
jgi:hypothetical protein